MKADALFCDGITSAEHHVNIGFGYKQLHIRTATQSYFWNSADITLRSNPHDGLPIRLGNEVMLMQRLEIHSELAWKRIKIEYPEIGKKSLHIPANLNILLLACVASVLLLWGLYTAIPAISESFAPYVPQSSKAELTKMIKTELFANRASCDAPEGKRVLQTMLTQLSENAHVSISVIDDSVANAVTLPDDSILIFKGLIAQAETPSELAGVIAHELGHVEHQHAAKNLVRMLGSNFLLTLITGGTTSMVDGTRVMHHILSSGYQRDMEREADEYAIALFKKKQLDLKDYAAFFKREKTQPEFFNYISTHPAHQERTDYIENHLVDYNAVPIISDKDWQSVKAVCAKTSD
jgi:beta-barrel assembly-enhancing protease